MMRIVGTAGHVDHGKSSLVAALTGTDPDRWAEEQLRGMTLDLGFAHLTLEGAVEAGIVDVPGHERFLHNMLAGAAGMDVLLLVVSAVEGVMPQTVEHLDILGYLNVRKTIVAMTMADLVDAQRLRDVIRETAEALRGTMAEGAPFVAVSGVTGEGLSELRTRIARALSELPERDARAPVYLPVDRAFTLDGVGTVVTGTLMQGTIQIGDTVTIHPSGQRARARSIHVFGKPFGSVEGGTRVAINLPGVARNDVARGAVIAGEEFAPRSSFSVRFTPLAAALPLLRRRTPVRAYVGAAEILGTLVFDRTPDVVEEVAAELHLREPTIGFPGVRFVVRRVSPKSLIGGGVIVEGAAEAPAIAPGYDRLEERALALLNDCGLDPIEADDAAPRVNARAEDTRAALDALVRRGEAVAVARPDAYVNASAARATLAQTLERLEAAHAAEPWSLGVTSIALARELELEENLLVRVLGAFVDDGRLANRGGYYALLDHQARLSDEQQALFDEALPRDPSQPLLPVPAETFLAALRASHVPGVQKAYDTLIARGALVKVGDSIYRGSQVAQIRARVESHLRANQSMTAADFRDLLGTSRKYAVPLLEWLDARGITVRSGDLRTLRKKSP
jgi:selenocysteine-specific elongation factor